MKQKGTSRSHHQGTDLVCFQETKVNHLSTQLMRSLGAGRLLECKAMDVRGLSGDSLVSEKS